MTGSIILAGGPSSRLGQDKRRLRLWGPAGPALLERTVTLARSLCDECIVVLHDPEQWQDLPVRLVPDQYPGYGPLGGLATGLAVLQGEYALLLACDMPLLQPALLHALLAAPRPYDALVPLRPASMTTTPGSGGSPRNRRSAEPLLALYRTTCLPVIQACLQRGERHMVAPFDQLDVRYMETSEWERFDPQGLSFLNINRPDDLAQAQRLIPYSLR